METREDYFLDAIAPLIESSVSLGKKVLKKRRQIISFYKYIQLAYERNILRIIYFELDLY